MPDPAELSRRERQTMDAVFALGTAAALLLAAAVAIPIAMLRAADEKNEAKTGAKLQPDTATKLKWGEPVNGLRMALAWPPMFDDEVLGKDPCFQLVVQNVTDKDVRFTAGDDAQNPRKMLIREGERIVQAISDPEVSGADWKLQPGQCGVLRLLTKEERDKDGTVPSSAIESDLSKIGRYHAIVQMEIAKAPAGAWTGKLVSGQTRGSADVAAAPAPKHKDARALYEIWQRHARANGDIPGALIGDLAAAVKTFIGYNPTWETVPKLNALLPRLEATRDWKPTDAIALLDEVAGVQDSPLQTTAEKATRHTIRKGGALPKKFADAPWGDAQPNGLRAAWVLEPGAAERRMGAALKARLLVHNPGQVPVMVQVPTWHQGWVKASDAKGAEVEASGLEWTTLAQLVPVRLASGEYIEINTPGVGLGPRAGMGPWAGPRVGSNVLAKPGDEVTLTHTPVPLDGSEVGVREDDPHVAGPGWWEALIKTRLARELPLPADAAERTQLLDSAVRELFATKPTAEETAAFTADQTPGALDALVKRLAARTDVVEFSGKLPTAPAKFRVLAADPAADKMPRVVLGPGEYPLSGGTRERGAATLKIVGRPVGDRRTNDAQILFEAVEATGIRAPAPHKLEVPDGWGTWAIVCRPGEGFFYVLHKGGARKIDYNKPAKVTDTPANDLPGEFRDEVKRQLDIHEISDAQQAEVFEKSAPPADAPAPKTAEASPPVTPAPGRVQPITDGKSSAQVLRAVGLEPVVILTGRALTAAPGSTSREGSVTMEVATSAKTETIRYTWPEDAPGFLDLKVGGYPVSHFDLSRGRVFFVHFERMEFSADVFQVPAGVKVPAITSLGTLTEAATAVTAWYAASDDRSRWECSRIVVPEREYKTGQPLDAAAEKIVWGEANDAGLRLGLGGLEPRASFPVGQQLPVKQYIRNDSTKAITFSPTQIFNEGLGGELVRKADGKKFPHKKGYPWQGFFHRLRLAPGHYIALGSGPMRTIMAEKDGSSPGGMDMMAHGFTVLPGEYTLRITHDIGQFQGRPVNFHFGDPRGAPGLGEWTGVLKSAAVPLRLVDEQVKTARAGGSEEFGGRYMIAFDKGVIRLRHYNGYPQMRLEGGPWEDGSRDWKVPAADGEYVAAWAVGGKGLWVKDASGITHLIVKDVLTETGRWKLDQATGGLGDMPAGVRAALQLPPLAVAQPFDFKKLPNAPGAAKISGDFFEMALSPGTVLKVPHGRREFFIESGGNAYGPAEGNPVVELGLTELLRARLAETPNTAGLEMLRHMIADGQGTIRDCAFRLLADLKAPQAPFDYDAVFHAMIHASIEDEHGPRELSPEAQMGYTWFHNLFHSTRLEWERTRSSLAAGSYQPGEALGADTVIVWTPGSDGMSLGVSGLPAGTNLEIGKSLPVVVYLRNDSTAPVKLSVPSEHNPGIQISLTDAAGKTHHAIYSFSAPLTGYTHHELAPGTGAKVADFDLEACATPEEADRAEHKEGKAHNPRLAVPAGSYELHLEYRNYQENPVPKGAASEWTGKVNAKPVPMKVAAATTKQQPAPEAPKSAAQAKPQHEYAQSLFKNWQASARTDGKIPGALIGHLARETDKAVKQITDTGISAKLAALRPNLDASRDWTQAEVVAVLDEITAIATAPVSWANLPMEKQVQEPLKPAAPAAEKPKGAAAKLTPDGLLGFWRGVRNGERMMLSFHRPPVETDVQLDIYFGNATIGALASFSIAPDGKSVALMLHSANGRVPFGTLHPDEAGTLRFESSDEQNGRPDRGGVVFTRDVDEPANEPRQKEPRELFAMWKTTANDDGTIPGTFIGMLAAEVRAYAKANPNLDSGMKLPKLLPRFVTSRDWTQEEAIKLLDDVAYYATEPIEARVAKAKLPSGALWRTMVPFEDIPVAIAQWSEAKDGLRIGMRVVEGEWRIGGKVRMELWLHNPGGKDVSFKTTGPDRQDAGVAVSAVGADGREHWAENGNVSLIAIPLHCTLPAGHIAKAKDVTLSFDGPDNKEQAWFAPKFRELAPGKYKLRCQWIDPHPSISIAGDWTGALAAPEVEFTLAAQVAPGKAGADSAPGAKPAAQLAKLPDDAYTKSGVPIGEFNAGVVNWSAEQNGLCLAMSVAEDAEWRIGGAVKVGLWVCNPGENDLRFQHCARRDIGPRVLVKGADGKERAADIAQFDSYPVAFPVLLPAGHIFKAKEFSVVFLPPGGTAAGAEPHFTLAAGGYKFRSELDLPGLTGTGADGKQRTPAEGEWTGTLKSGEVDVKLVGTDAPAAKPVQAKPAIEHATADIAQDGAISLDREKVTLEELKARAAKNAKKWFTVRADKDVPYAKVIEVVEALKAAGVTEFSFAEARVGDGKYRVANRQAGYKFDDKHHFSICRPSDYPQFFTVSWPAEGERPACWLRTYPNVSGQTQGKWAVVWEPGTNVLWWVDDSDVGKMTVTDPAHVIVDREGRKNNFSRNFALPEGVKDEFRRLGFVVGRDKTPGLEGTIGGNTGGQSIVSAEARIWSVEGTVTDADGKPMKDVPVRLRANQEIKTEKTDEKGHYYTSFSLPLQLLAKWRDVTVEPVLEGFTERDMAKAGEFHSLFRAGEQPQRLRVAGDKDFQPGPIPRFAARDLLPSQPGVSPGTSGRTDFVMLKAGEITGEIVTADGKPAPPHFIAAATPEQRPGHNAAIELSDAQGHFRLKGIPANKPVIFTVNPDGKPGETSKSSEQRFEQTGTHKIRITLPVEGSGKGPVKIERFGAGAEETKPARRPQ